LPADAEPRKVCDHGFDILRFGALRVEVFVAEKKYAVGVASALKGMPKGCRVAKVEKACGTGSKSADVGRVHHFWAVLRARVFSIPR
jgi:hypothetical protein